MKPYEQLNEQKLLTDEDLEQVSGGALPASIENIDSRC